MNTNNNTLPDFVFGGTGKNWSRFGNIVVNDSKEGWDSVNLYIEYIVSSILVIGGIILLICGLIPLAIILIIIGILTFIFDKFRKVIVTIFYILFFIAIIIGVLLIL